MRRKSHTPRIFLSYSHKDREFGIRLVTYLRQVIGSEDAVWFDNGLRGGENWLKKIMKELENCNRFIVLLSPDALKSLYVEEEVTFALKLCLERKMIFAPILYRSCKIPAYLHMRQFLSFLSPKDYDKSIKDLLEALELPLSGTNIPRFILEDETFANVSSPVSNTATEISHIQKMTQNIEDAFERQDWCGAIAIANILIDLYPSNTPTSIYEKLGLAYIYIDKPCNEQYILAQNALKQTLVHTRDPQKRLSLLDAYTFALMQENRWDMVENCIKEANKELKLVPNHYTSSVWPLLQAEMPIIEPEEEISEPIVDSSSKKVRTLKAMVLALLLSNLLTPLFYRLIKKRAFQLLHKKSM